MQVQQIPLDERIKIVKADMICDETFFSRMIQQWAEMPIKAYLDSGSPQWKTLCYRLGLEVTANPTYQEIAVMINESDEAFGAVLRLMAGPIWDVAKRRKKDEPQ